MWIVPWDPFLIFFNAWIVMNSVWTVNPCEVIVHAQKKKKNVELKTQHSSLSKHSQCATIFFFFWVAQAMSQPCPAVSIIFQKKKRSKTHMLSCPCISHVPYMSDKSAASQGWHSSLQTLFALEDYHLIVSKGIK